MKLDDYKGQLISKCLFGVFNPPKNEPKQVLCPIHVVTFTWILLLATYYIQKRRGQTLLFSFEYNLLPKFDIQVKVTKWIGHQSSKIEFVCSFFGGNVGLKNLFDFV